MKRSGWFIVLSLCGWLVMLLVLLIDWVIFPAFCWLYETCGPILSGAVVVFGLAALGALFLPLLDKPEKTQPSKGEEKP